MLVLLIPLGMIGGLVQEREDRKLEVDSEITSQWGGPQTILGPILTVPYRYVTEAAGENGVPRTATFVNRKLKPAGSGLGGLGTEGSANCGTIELLGRISYARRPDMSSAVKMNAPPGKV